MFKNIKKILKEINSMPKISMSDKGYILDRYLINKTLNLIMLFIKKFQVMGYTFNNFSMFLLFQETVF